MSKQILESRYSLLARQELEIQNLEAAQSKKGLATDFGAQLVSPPSASDLASALKRRPIIVLGDVGVGKTIFLRHLIRVTAKAEFKKAITLYVDFLREPAIASDLSAFVQKRCETLLRSDYLIDIEESTFVRDVYRSELSRFGKGINSAYRESNPTLYLEKETTFLEEKINDRAGHLRASLEQIVKAHHRQVVLFLDNIDQRPSDFQEQVYSIGHALAENWPIITFICLRPDTFYHSRHFGSLTAYQPKVFSITPPRIDLVVTRRLRYAIQKMDTGAQLSSLPENIALNSPSLRLFLIALTDSLSFSTDLTELLDNFSGRNVRIALDFINTFIGSGHVDSKKIIQKQETEGYVVSVHEFLRALIYGDNEHFDPDASQICNVFDISLPDGREHFLLLILLSFVERRAEGSEGFVSASSLFEFLQDQSFSGTQVHWALQRATRKRLVEPYPQYSTSEMWEKFRITSVGAYTLHRLVNFFAYVDAMIVDTPIVDRLAQDSITNAVDISQRVARIDLFLAYLDIQAQKIDWNSAGYDWPSARAKLDADLVRVKKGAANAARARSDAKIRPRA